MSEYIGKRIVPKHCGEWNSGTAYEVLSIVLDKSTGDSYISRKEVPAGTELTDTEYWALCSQFSSQIDLLDKDLGYVETDIDLLGKRLDNMVAASTDADADYASEVADARVDSFGNTYDSLSARLNRNENAFIYRDMVGLFITSDGLVSKTHDSYSGICTDKIMYDASFGSIILDASHLVLDNVYVSTIAFYDSSGAFLSRYYQTSDFTVSGGLARVDESLIPEGTAYFAVSLDSKTDSLYLRFSNAAVMELVDFTGNLVTEQAKSREERTAQMEARVNRSLPCGRNLFDKDSAYIVEGHFLSAGGAETENSSYYISDYIKVLPGADYLFTWSSGGSYCCIYDGSFNVIGNFKGKTAVTIPEEGRYVRLSVNAGADTAMFAFADDVPAEFEPYLAAEDVDGKIGSTADALWLSVDGKLDRRCGKNLFDKDSAEIVYGSYMLASGRQGTNASYFISPFIPVEEGETYFPYGFGSGGAYHCVFAADKTTVVTTFKDAAVEIPEGGVYVRLSGVIASMSLQQFEKGDSYTGYEQYTEYYPVLENSRRTDELEEKLEKLSEDAARVDALNRKLDKRVGKNLFDKDSDEIIYGSYLMASGRYGVNDSYFISPFIPVTEGKTYTLSGFGVGGAYHCVFASDQATLVSNFKTDTITIPEGGAFLRLSGLIANMAVQQVEEGDTATAYEAYTEYCPVLENSQRIDRLEEKISDISGDALRAILPGKLYFCKDTPLSVYIENILYKSYTDPGDVYCDAGSRSERMINFSFDKAETGELAISTMRGLRQISRQSFAYEVSDPADNDGKERNLLFIGDSFTDGGAYLKETKSLLEKSGAVVNLLGTCGNSTFRAEGLSGGTLSNTFLTASAGVARIVHVTGVMQMPNTGYPGRTYRDGNGNDWLTRGWSLNGDGSGLLVVTNYLAKEEDFEGFPESGTLTKVSSGGEGDEVITYSGVEKAYYNPFINHETGELDIAYYLNYWQYKNPDIIVFQFTWNDTSLWKDDLSALVANFKTAVDHVHGNLPDAKVVISIEPCGSVFSTRDWNGKKYTVLHLAEQLCETFETEEYSDFCIIAPSYACVDLIYGYSGGTVTPNSRYPALTETSPGDGVHPGTGMYQIADCLFPVITKLIQ